MDYNNGNLDFFERVTNYDLYSYFKRYKDFISNYYESISNYYEGQKCDKNAFLGLNNLIEELKTIDSLFMNNRDSLSNDISFWDLLTDYENIRTNLFSIKNMGKWKRSSYIYRYDSSSKNSYILGKNETLEQLSDKIGINDYEQNWVNLAIDNKLLEVDYDSDGGNELLIPLNKTNSKINYGIVDYSNEDLILGKDMVRKITILDNDVLCVEGIDCFSQAAEICLSVCKGSVPEFKYLGYNKDIIGNSYGNIMFSNLRKDIVNNFKTDETFSNVELLAMNKNGDIIESEVNITSINNVKINLGN